jgi:hypothetical protein
LIFLGDLEDGLDIVASDHSGFDGIKDFASHEFTPSSCYSFLFEWKLYRKIYLMCLFYQALSEGKQMSALAVIAWILGTFAIGGGLLAAGAPAMVRRGMEKYPRSVWPGRVLLAIDMVWAAYAINQMHLGGADALKVHLYWLAPVLIVIGCLYLDEMLSVRALGGLLLLAAGPMLNIIRWNPSAWRYVITVLAYLWIGIGLLWLMEPWWFRRMAERVQSPTVIRAAGVLKVLAGIVLIVLALLVY